MKPGKIVFVALAPIALMALQARGHDTSQHISEVEDPDCSAVHYMADTSSSAEDPVLQAMMMRCDMPQGDHDHMKANDHQQEARSNRSGEGHRE